MKVKLVSDEVTYYKKGWDSIIEINGKQVRVHSYDDHDYMLSNYDSDRTINEEDLKTLTEEEEEVLGEFLNEITAYKEGEEWDTEEEVGCLHNFQDGICKTCGEQQCEKCGLPHDTTDCDKEEGIRLAQEAKSRATIINEEEIEFTEKQLENIDEITNEIMDMLRLTFKFKSDSDLDDQVYTFIHSAIKEGGVEK
jgi:hypothetical protein